MISLIPFQVYRVIEKPENTAKTFETDYIISAQTFDMDYEIHFFIDSEIN